MDPNVRLRAGQQAFREGRYEDALNEYIWFHDHALEHDRGYYGVRLSFALAYWLELASVYPKARAALEEIRDRKTELIRTGRGDRELFHDVESINERLNALDATHRLFVHLNHQQPELANHCVDLALPALIAARDFELARRLLPDPEAAIRAYGEHLNTNLGQFAAKEATRAPVRQAYVSNYATDVRQIVDVLAGTGDSGEATRLAALAVSIVEDAEIRRAVEDAIGRETGSPTPRSS